VPSIDRAYKTDPAPEKRATLGKFYGDVNAAYCALTYPDVFHPVPVTIALSRKESRDQVSVQPKRPP
jgi:hypothetical protein